MILRYSLYGDVSTWNGNVQEDVEGQWLKWKDTEAYVEYALANGYTPPIVEEPKPKVREGMSADKYMEREQLALFDSTLDVLSLESDNNVLELIDTSLADED
jgi:hypothetical protein